jgi:dienelactone hydrolase
MTRREFVFSIAYPGTPYREYARVLPDYLRSLAERAYQARNRALERITTPAAARARQKWARETFWRLAGGSPERTPLNARVAATFERPGYRLEKVVYESLPRFFVPANLYIPTVGTPPFPAVLFQMGHTANGKAAESYQRCCQGLARLGFVVLGFDPMGQGERIYYPDASGTRTRLKSSDDEHTTPGRQMLLVGSTATQMQTWDAVRSLDYLAAHPLVDAARIGATGQSGGGTTSMLIACADDRVAAVAVFEGNTENFACAGFRPPGSTDDAEQNLIASGPEGFDRWDLLWPQAPKPLLVSASDKDAFGTYSSSYIASGWEEFGKLRRIYALLGAADRLEWHGTPLQHGLTYDGRVRVYDFFARRLKRATAPVSREPETAPEEDTALWVAAEGNMVRSFASRTPREIAVASLRRGGPTPLDRLLRLERPPADARFSTLRRVAARHVDIEAVEVASAPGVWIPAWLYVPRAEKPRLALLALEAGGRNAGAREDGLYETLAARGALVCAADVRGIGDLAPEHPRGHASRARTHSDEENFAWASLILGRPLVGQRVADILALAAALRARGAPKLRLAASGRLTVPALCAAALDARIDELYLAGPLVSFASVLERDQYNTPLANFIPGILRHTDLPEIASAIAPRPIVLAGAVDGAGKTMDAARVRALYAENADVRPRARWDEEILG